MQWHWIIRNSSIWLCLLNCKEVDFICWIYSFPTWCVSVGGRGHSLETIKTFNLMKFWSVWAPLSSVCLATTSSLEVATPRSNYNPIKAPSWPYLYSINKLSNRLPLNIFKLISISVCMVHDAVRMLLWWGGHEVLQITILTVGTGPGPWVTPG